jgi:hypothetical protein
LSEPVFAAKAPAVIAVAGKDDRHLIAVLEQRGDRTLVSDFPKSPGWIQTSLLRSKYGWEGYALYLARQPTDLLPVRDAVALESWRSVFLWILAIVVTYGTIYSLWSWRKRSIRLYGDRTRRRAGDPRAADDVSVAGRAAGT